MQNNEFWLLSQVININELKTDQSPKCKKLSNRTLTRKYLSVQSLSCVLLFATSWIAASQALLSITNSWNLLKLMSIESVMPSNHLILCCPLLFQPSIIPSIRIFPLSQFFASGGQSFSFTINPCNEYSGLISFRIDWLDSLQSKGLSIVFSTTTVQNHQFFVA